MIFDPAEKTSIMQRNSSLLLIFGILFLSTSCIPVRIAPNIDTHKIMLAKKFKRKLPRETSFIFEDPKQAYEFYNYINTKFQLNDTNVGMNTPFEIEGKTYYLTYLEAEKITETINIPLALIDAKRENNGNSRLFEGSYSSRTGEWYLVLSIHDDNLKNCLLDDYPNKQRVVAYLEAMRQEYLNTSNYLDVYFAQK